MAFRSIGGTDLHVVRKHDWMSRKDSKMSTNVESYETDPTRDMEKSTGEIDLLFKEINTSKEIAVERP